MRSKLIKIENDECGIENETWSKIIIDCFLLAVVFTSTWSHVLVFGITA